MPRGRFVRILGAIEIIRTRNRVAEICVVVDCRWRDGMLESR